MRTPIICITKWAEKAKIVVLSKISFWFRILLFFRWVTPPIKEYCYYIDIEIAKGGGLRKGDTILLHDRPESAWICINKEGDIFNIGCYSTIADMCPYTGPAIIISNTYMENETPI